MATAEEKRLMVRNKYRTIIGRNIYSQDRRNYCYKKYSNGKYYSDCSSSICHTYKEVGLGFGILNTAGMWVSKKLVDVPVKIKNGIIQNPEVLRIGDMLLFAGTNASRKPYGYVGHVEMVGEISGKTVTLYGHGSGNPKKHEMNAYCKYRYGKRTKKTPLGHTGLIRVRRFIQDDGSTKLTVSTQTRQEVSTYNGIVLGVTTIKKGMEGLAVKEMQAKLIKLGFSCGAYGADGKFGSETKKAVKAFQGKYELIQTGEFGPSEYKVMIERIANQVEITGGSINVREGAGTEYDSIGIVMKGEKYQYLKETAENGWHLIEYDGQKAWVSGIYTKLIE